MMQLLLLTQESYELQKQKYDGSFADKSCREREKAREFAYYEAE